MRDQFKSVLVPTEEADDYAKKCSKNNIKCVKLKIKVDGFVDADALRDVYNMDGLINLIDGTQALCKNAGVSHSMRVGIDMAICDLYLKAIDRAHEIVDTQDVDKKYISATHRELSKKRAFVEHALGIIKKSWDKCLKSIK